LSLFLTTDTPIFLFLLAPCLGAPYCACLLKFSRRNLFFEVTCVPPLSSFSPHARSYLSGNGPFFFVFSRFPPSPPANFLTSVRTFACCVTDSIPCFHPGFSLRGFLFPRYFHSVGVFSQNPCLRCVWPDQRCLSPNSTIHRSRLFLKSRAGDSVFFFAPSPLSSTRSIIPLLNRTVSLFPPTLGPGSPCNLVFFFASSGFPARRRFSFSFVTHVQRRFMKTPPFPPIFFDDLLCWLSPESPVLPAAGTKKLLFYAVPPPGSPHTSKKKVSETDLE